MTALALPFPTHPTHHALLYLVGLVVFLVSATVTIAGATLAEHHAAIFDTVDEAFEPMTDELRDPAEVVANWAVLVWIASAVYLFGLFAVDVLKEVSNFSGTGNSWVPVALVVVVSITFVAGVRGWLDNFLSWLEKPPQTSSTLNDSR